MMAILTGALSILLFVAVAFYFVAGLYLICSSTGYYVLRYLAWKSRQNLQKIPLPISAEKEISLAE